MEQKIIKVVVCKLGPDGEDKSIKEISKALRDEGMEVVYIGSNKEFSNIINTIIQEDPDVIIISIMDGFNDKRYYLMAEKLSKEEIYEALIFINNENKSILKKIDFPERHGPPMKLKDTIKFIKNSKKYFNLT